MKNPRILSIAWLALLGFALNAFSQSTYTRIDSVIVYQYPAANDSVPYSKSITVQTDTVGEVTKISTFKWDGTINGWKGERKFYTYWDEWGNSAIYLNWKWDQVSGDWFQTSKYFAETDGFGNVIDDSNYYRRLGDDAWTGYSKTSSVYDSVGNKEIETEFKWNDVDRAWEHDLRQEFAFDTAGRVTARSSFEWRIYSSNWFEIEKRRYIYEFDQYRRLSEYAEIMWDKNNEKWDSIKKSQFVYLNDSALALEVNYDWFEQKGWTLKSKTEYTYDNGGNLLQYLSSDWLNETWIGRRKEEYTFDELGYQTKKASYDNPYGDHVDWIGDDRRDNVFDESGNRISSAVYDWDHDTKSWVGLYRNQTMYDSVNRPVFYNTELWNQDSLDWLAYKSHLNIYPDTLYQSINSEYMVEDNSQDSILQDREFHYAQGQYFRIAEDLCEGEVYYWRGDSIETTGVYYENFLTQEGSDSTYVLSLHVHANPDPFEIIGDTSFIKGETGRFLAPEKEEVNYHWMVENGSILNDNPSDTIEINWDVAGEGRVLAYAISQYGCTSDTARLEIYVGLSIVNNRGDTDVLIYPVPVKDILRIQADFELGSLEVLDMKGTVLKRFPDQVIDLSTLNSGIYLVRIKDKKDELKAIRKIVKE